MSDTQIKKQAVLVGINEYDILPVLKYARQDAEAVAQSLKFNYCFSDDEVTLLTDSRGGVFKPSNRVRILSQLDILANQDLDLLIFGFWGHGVVRNGKRYLCPKDVSPDEVEQLGVPFDDLMSKLTKIRAKNTCLILDCCQSVQDGERGEVETLTAADQKTIENAARNIVFIRKEKEPEFQSNVAILNSCKQGQAAYEWDNRKHGIFTAHLLDAMNRRYDTIAQIVGYVNSNVEKTAKQLNKQQTPLCSLEGDIHLPVDTKTTTVVTGDVFVSYRHSNETLVAPIEEELKNRGISYFIDRVGVNYTAEYGSVLAQAVKECKVLLFVWTQDANDSRDILREVSMAVALNKRVLPYKIGTFDVKEHSSLFYQLSPISRYEVPKQTPETIIELVNQVQLALTGETYQQYSFNIPVNSADAVIEKPEIDNINIAISPTIIEQQESIQFDQITLPPKPEELLRIPAENEALQDAIEQLKSFTHESLVQANIAFQQTEAQLELWKIRREERWKDLPKQIQNMWEQAIIDNPDCTEKDIDLRKTQKEIIADNPSLYSTIEQQNHLFMDLFEKFQCGKKYQQAMMELERVKQERESKCQEVIARFQKQIEDNKSSYNDRLSLFFNEVLLKVLSVMDGYDVVDAKFPVDSIGAPLLQLDKYKLGWEAPNEMDRARKLWEEERPCVVAKRRLLAAKEELYRIWKKLKENLIYTFLFLIGVSLLVLGGYLLNGADPIHEKLYKFLYMSGASSLFIIGLPLCISVVILWAKFELDILKYFLVRYVISLGFVSLLTLGITSFYYLGYCNGLSDDGQSIGYIVITMPSIFSAIVYFIGTIRIWFEEIDRYNGGFFFGVYLLGGFIFFLSGGLSLYYNLVTYNTMFFPLFISVHSVIMGLFFAIFFLVFLKLLIDLDN